MLGKNPLHPLDSSRAKIERAKQHHRALVHDAAVWMVGETEALADTHPMTIRKEADPEPGKEGGAVVVFEVRLGRKYARLAAATTVKAIAIKLTARLPRASIPPYASGQTNVPAGLL